MKKPSSKPFGKFRVGFPLTLYPLPRRGRGKGEGVKTRYEFIKQRTRIKSSAVSKLLGFRLVKTGRGRSECVMRMKKEHVNTIGTIHGGILCDLSDAAMGYAFTTLLAPGERGVTVEFKINFLKPALPGDRLRASAKVISKGKSLGYIECEVRDVRGRLIAKAASTCKSRWE